jgi:hypothetical protein
MAEQIVTPQVVEEDPNGPPIHFKFNRFDIDSQPARRASGGKHGKSKTNGLWMITSTATSRNATIGLDFGGNLVIGGTGSGKTTVLGIHAEELSTTYGLSGMRLFLGEPGGQPAFFGKATREMFASSGSLEELIEKHHTSIDFLIVDSLSMPLFLSGGAGIVRGLTGRAITAFTNLSNLCLHYSIALIGVVNPVVSKPEDVAQFNSILMGRTAAMYVIEDFVVRRLRSRADEDESSSKFIQTGEELTQETTPVKYFIPQIDPSRL